MGQCTVCGRKGLFLKLDSKKRCPECAKIAEELERKELNIKRITPSYIGIGVNRRFKSRVYNCDIALYSGGNLPRYEEVTFKDNNDKDLYYPEYRVKVLHRGKMIGYVGRPRIADMVMSEYAKAYLSSASTGSAAFDVAVYSRITSLPSLKAIALKSTDDQLVNYRSIKNSILQFEPVEIKNNICYHEGKEIGMIPEKDLPKLQEVPADREQYPVFYSERTGKTGKPILTIKIYYSIADDDLFRDTSKYFQ